jgi:hypothetical protein
VVSAEARRRSPREHLTDKVAKDECERACGVEQVFLIILLQLLEPDFDSYCNITHMFKNRREKFIVYSIMLRELQVSAGQAHQCY